MPKRVIYLVIILILVMIITGCGLPKKKQPTDEEPLPDENNEEAMAHLRKTVMYFINENNLLVPVAKDIPWVEGIAKASLEGLVDTDELRAELQDKGLKPPLPKDTKVIGIAIRDGLAKVDLNEDFLCFQDKMSEKNAIDSVVYTLTEFPSIDMVQIFVNGKTLSITQNGNQLDEVFCREHINLETLTYSSSEMVPVTLYFKSGSPQGNFDYYVPVTRMTEETQNQIKTALEELVKGPMDGVGLASSLPCDTKVLDVVKMENEVVVNFSKEIEQYGGGIDGEQSVINAVVMTVSEFPGVETVYIQVEGQADILPEGTMLDVPIFRPLYINPGGI